MQLIELDTWAFLTRPASMTIHGRASFMWFIERYMRDAPGQGYSYGPSDVYAARCGLLHTFGALADMHEKDKSVAVWRFHLGKLNTFVPGLEPRMAYISVTRFIMDAQTAIRSACSKELLTDDAMKKRVGNAYRVCLSIPVFSRAAIQMTSRLWTPGLMRRLPRFIRED